MTENPSFDLGVSQRSYWSGVGAMTMCVALLIASAFMPVSLLTPIAADLRATQGMAGQALSVSGLFAVVSSLCVATAAGRFAVVNLAWLWASMPPLPARQAMPLRRVLGLLERRNVALAMLGVMLSFGGAFATFTYLRPFLETQTQATLPQLSLLLLALGVAGFAGTWGPTSLLGRHLYSMLRLLPVALAAVTLAMLVPSQALWPMALMMAAWGALNSAMPVSWSNWLAVGGVDAPEAAGGLMVAAIQLAIMLAASFGGFLLDHFSITATLVGGAALLLLAAAVPVTPAKAIHEYAS